MTANNGVDRGSLLDSLFRQHAPVLQLYARQWCDTPEDVVQEGLVRLAMVADLPDDPVGWLFRVVRNRAIEVSRTADRRRRRETAIAQKQRLWFTSDNGVHLDATAVTEALAELTIEQREVIVAYLWGELTFAEIGELVGCSTGTAHRRYNAGLSVLRERIDQ